jgi:hypothetical protein
VDEYPDVFLEELQGMPPNHDIELVPVHKSPYRMSGKQLVELKVQI